METNLEDIKDLARDLSLIAIGEEVIINYDGLGVYNIGSIGKDTDIIYRDGEEVKFSKEVRKTGEVIIKWI